VVFITADKITPVKAPGTDMRMCSFLWAYYGYPTSDYEGKNVEEVRYRCGQNLAEGDNAKGPEIQADYVAGIPDSGTAHAVGYANRSKIPFARPLIKYTPTWTRSFTPKENGIRNLVARMKLVPVNSLIENKRLLFVEDSIVRGTQMRALMDFLLDCGVKELHVRLGCPPVLFACKYLNFTRSNSESELVSRQAIEELEPSGQKDIAAYADCESKQYKNMVETIRKNLNIKTLKYLSLEGLLASIGIDKCKLCTYCWNGIEN
jgi:amidophosphoribosyltransferase